MVPATNPEEMFESATVSCQHQHPAESGQMDIEYCSASDVTSQISRQQVEQFSLDELPALANDLYRQTTLGVRWCLERCRVIGIVLLVAKAKSPRRRGVFRKWVEEHCSFGYREGQRYMRLAAKWDELLANAGVDPALLAKMTLSRALSSIKRPRPKSKATRSRKPADQLQFSSEEDIETAFAQSLERAKAIQEALNHFLDASTECVVGLERFPALIDQHIALWSQARERLAAYRPQAGEGPSEPAVGNTGLQVQHVDSAGLPPKPRLRKLIPNESPWNGMRHHR